MPVSRQRKKETKQPLRPKNNKQDAGYVHDMSGEKYSEEELQKKFASLSFDPYDITECIMEFGMALTGIPLYSYQYDFAFRVIFAIITFENETLTALWSRQSGKSEDMAFISVTLMVILPALANMEVAEMEDDPDNPGQQRVKMQANAITGELEPVMLPVFPEFKQFKKGFKIGLYAPQQLQVDTTYDRVFERIENANPDLLGAPGIEVGLSSHKHCNLTNGSFMTAQVASKTSKIESKTFHMVICEESQEMDDFIVQKSIEPMVSATAGTILKIGTTGTQKNQFYKDIQHNKKRQRNQKDRRMLFHFEFDYIAVIKYKREQFEKDGDIFHLNYEKDVMKKRDKWGKDSDAFKLGFALIWPLESGMFLTDADWTRMTNKKLGLPNKIEGNWVVCAGVDYGKDKDSTVITLVRVFYRDDEYTTEPPIKQIIGWVRLSRVDYESQHHIILETLVTYQVQICYCDYTGVGKAPTDRLIAACGGEVLIVPYTFTTPSKSDMYQALEADIRAGRWITPANKQTAALEEFQEYEVQMKGLYKQYDRGYLVCYHGDDPGDHDDYCDSAALACMAGNHELPEEMEEEANVLYDKGDFHISHRNCHW